MTIDRLHRASQYTTLFLATLLLSVDAPRDNRFAMLYPVVVGGLAVLALLTVDRDPKRGIPRDVANFLSLLACAFGLLEYYNDPSTLLLAIGHTLVYLMAVKLFLPKSVEDDWYLNLIGLVVAVIGVYSSQSDLIGVLLILWALMSLWTLGLFFLRREAARRVQPAQVTIRSTIDTTDPYRGLINAGFILSTLGIASATLALGMLVFLLMPRWPVKGQNRFGNNPSAKHLTGFSNQVTLGQMGEILESDGIVMSVEFSDQDNASVVPEPDILLRGLSLTRYENGGWDRADPSYASVESFGPLEAGRGPFVRQRYKLEPTDGDVLFALRPILRVASQNPGEILFNERDGSLVRRDQGGVDGDGRPNRPNKYDYTVISGVRDPAFQPGELDRSGDSLVQVPEDLKGPLIEISKPVLDTLRPEVRASKAEIARSLQRFLRDGDYTYTLRMTVVDRGIDPVLDFLRNRKEGHCEYFASALTLLCRAQGIPARMVNGFKGGDWEGLGRVLHVREKHAHSWVEVLVQSNGLGMRWETLDPTPSRQRAEVVAKVGGNAVKLHYLTNPIRSFWTFGVAGYDAERQQRLIYAPARALRDEAIRGFRIMGQMFRDMIKWFYFESAGQFFSVRGFFVSVVAMLSFVGLYQLGAWSIGRLFGRLRSKRSEGVVADPGLAFYYRMMIALAAIELRRPSAETPREFARRAVGVLENRPECSVHAAVPPIVIDLFYAKRFGAREPQAEELREIEARLSALEASLARTAS